MVFNVNNPREIDPLIKKISALKKRGGCDLPPTAILTELRPPKSCRLKVESRGFCRLLYQLSYAPTSDAAGFEPATY